MSSLRAFIALPASTDIQQKMAVIQSQIKEAQADVKWEHQNKFHITIKFLGDVEESIIQPLASALANAVHRVPAFEMTYQSLGVFPNLHNPRIVWIGTTSHQSVLNLHSSVEHVCSQFGFPNEERPFHPHITLGRIKGSHNLHRLTDAIKTITFEPMQSRCSEVLLMKSDLRQSGSIYTILKSFPLQS